MRGKARSQPAYELFLDSRWNQAPHTISSVGWPPHPEGRAPIVISPSSCLRFSSGFALWPVDRLGRVQMQEAQGEKI